MTASIALMLGQDKGPGLPLHIHRYRGRGHGAGVITGQGSHVTPYAWGHSEPRRLVQCES